MTFQEQLNLYIEELSCSGRELAQNSGISETILSRYRKGERLPGADSDYLKKLAAGIALTAEQKGKKKDQESVPHFLIFWKRIATKKACADGFWRRRRCLSSRRRF